MNIQASNSMLKPIVKQPQNDFDSYKAPRQERMEREKNTSNDIAKGIVREYTNKVHQNMQKQIDKLEPAINYRLSETGSTKQTNIHMKNSGTQVASIPPEIATIIADQAKHQTVGQIIDFMA